MILLKHLKKQNQQIEHLFGGSFVENKPIPFPQNGTTLGYSNLFYWAHLEAGKTDEFPLHPHQGFEIVTFVLKGTVEHYDTVSKKWTALNAGDIQVIQAGSGVEHSERIQEGSEMFQIWFDPDMSLSMKKEPQYKDYDSSLFRYENINGLKKLFYMKKDGVVTYDTVDLEVARMKFNEGKYTEELEQGFIYSYYLLDGEMSISGEMCEKDDFLIFNYCDSVEYEVKKSADLFVIKSPSVVPYSRFIERYKHLGL